MTKRYATLDKVPRRRKDEPKKLAALSRTQMEAAAADPDAAPPLDPSWFREATLVLPGGKSPVTLRLDNDVLEWLRAKGDGYQTRINAILREWMNADRGRW